MASWMNRKAGLSRGVKMLRRSGLRPRRHSIETRSGLIQELDRVTSLIVRKRDEYCVTCGEARPELLTASHFYSRRWLNVRFDLRNVNCQCLRCNCIVHVSNVWPYTSWFVNHYGTDVMHELFTLRNRRETPSTDELKFMLSEYRQALREMT
jgi:hypothetical protein